MISAVVLTKNEEKNVKDCLKGLQWCDEVLVIDDFSKDKTREIAKKMGFKVFKRSLEGDFSAQRNFGLKKARGEWVLFVDADERITPRLTEEIKKAIGKEDIGGFYFHRKDWFGGRWLKHGETAAVKLLRLGRKGRGRWQGRIHEVWQIRGKTRELKNPLLHYSHPNLSQFITQINFHSSFHAESLKERGIKFSLFRLIANPLGKFIQNYFLRLGFLDGAPGFLMAMMMSFHSFLARGKLYQLWKK